MEDGTHHFLQYSRVQLEGCSPAVLKSRAMDLRDALGGVAASPLPSGSAALISWILEAQASAPEVDPSHGEQKTTEPGPAPKAVETPYTALTDDSRPEYAANLEAALSRPVAGGRLN